MTIDDLKTLMDEFDPASLLPEIDSIVGWIELIMRVAVMIGPVVLLVLGLSYLLLPPKEANYYFGYRCYFGMGSVNAWRFTQRLAGMIWSVLGLVLSAVMLIISSGFRGQEVTEMLWSAIRCVLWQAGLVAVSCITINVVLACLFTRQGERRRARA